MGKLGWAQQAAVSPGLGLRCSYCGLTGHAKVSCCYKLVMPAEAHQAAGSSHLGLWCSYCGVLSFGTSWESLHHLIRQPVDTALFKVLLLQSQWTY